jgi:dipeptidyl aminopeptidase/acylaminoacyl peptidase
MRELVKAAAAAILLALAAGPAGAAPPARISAEAFGDLPFIRDPQISPDGRYVVAESVMDKKKALVLADLSVPNYGIGTIAIPDKAEMIWMHWAGSRRVLMNLLVPQRLDGTAIKVIRLFMFDMDTKSVRMLGDRIGGFDGGDVIFYDPAGAYILLAAAPTLFDAPAVLRVDLATGKATGVVAARPGVWSWYADPGGVVRAGLGLDEKGRYVLYYRENEGADFHKVAKWEDPNSQTMTDVERPVVTINSNEGYVVANKATGRYGVYRYDFGTGKIGAAVYENPDVDVNQDGVDISERTGALDAIDYVDDRDRVFWIDPAMKAIQARLDKALPGMINRIESRDASNRLMVVHSSSASDPGSYYVFDSAKRELREFAKPYAALDGATLAPVTSVHYAARDGLSIPAYLTLSVGRPGKNLPLIVLPHGGPFLRDKWEYSDWVQFLANRGYAVLQPNYRGSTGYGKAFVDAATGEWGRKMQDDLDDGVHWLAGQGTIDPKRVCIMGGSYGGYAAMWAAVRNPDIYRCAISFAGISDMGAMLRHDATWTSATRYTRDWRQRVGAKGQDMESVSALPRAAEIRIPILIAHGKKDHTVPVSQSIHLHEALEKAGKPNEYVLYPDEGHGFSKVEDSVDFLNRLDAFLGRYNPAG